MLISCLVTSAAAPEEWKPENEYSVSQLEGRVAGYGVMSGFGLLTLATGLALLPTGIVNLAQSDSETNPHVGGISVSNPDEKAKTGIRLIIASVPCLAAGTVLSVIGLRKTREYNNRLKLARLQYGFNGEAGCIEAVFEF